VRRFIPDNEKPFPGPIYPVWSFLVKTNYFPILELSLIKEGFGTLLFRLDKPSPENGTGGMLAVF